MPRTSYLITAATAFALGAGTVQVADLNAVAAISTPRDHEVKVVLSDAAATTFRSFLQTQACSLVDADLGLAGGDACNVARDFINAGIYANDSDHPGKLVLKPTFRVAGSWTAGAPQ